MPIATFSKSHPHGCYCNTLRIFRAQLGAENRQLIRLVCILPKGMFDWCDFAADVTQSVAKSTPINAGFNKNYTSFQEDLRFSSLVVKFSESRTESLLEKGVSLHINSRCQSSCVGAYMGASFFKAFGTLKYSAFKFPRATGSPVTSKRDQC